MVKLLLLDVDGTLTKDRNTEALEPEAISAVQGIVGKYTVGLATGNALIVTQALARYIGLPRGSPLIAENGCILEVRGEVHELCEDLGLRDVAMRIITRVSGVRATYQFNYRRFDITLSVLGNPHEVITRIKEELRKMGLEDKVRVLFSGYAVHIQPAGSGKGKAVLELCRLMGIDPSEVAYVGDSETDVEAVSIVGYGVAVGNAADELKRVAKLVLRKPSGLGVAEFIGMLNGDSYVTRSSR